MDKDTEIFKGTSFAHLAEDIYNTSKKKEAQIMQIVNWDVLGKWKVCKEII